MITQNLECLGKLLVGIAFLLMTAGPAHAQTIDAEDIPQQIDLYDVILKYPQPAWIKGQVVPTALLDQSEFYRDHSGSTFLLEQIPDGEEFESWTRLYAVAAEELSVGRRAMMREFVALAADQNELACADGNFGVQTLRASETDAMLFMVCGSTENASTSIGYGPDVGEASLWRFLIFEDTYVKVYQRWRGPAFDIDARARWPVGEPELDDMVQRMTNGIQLFGNVPGQ
jgi:hypothetical protein